MHGFRDYANVWRRPSPATHLYKVDTRIVARLIDRCP
jgi:hypothetical protein